MWFLDNLSKKYREWKLINLVNGNWGWLYRKTNLYNDLIKVEKVDLKLVNRSTNIDEEQSQKLKYSANTDYIKSLDINEINKWINRIEKDIDWHSEWIL